VPTTVNVLLETSGAADLEYAVPNSVLPWQVWAPYSQQVADPDVDTAVDINIGNSVVNSDSVLDASYCIGEKILSARQLLKKFSSYCLLSSAVNKVVNVRTIDTGIGDASAANQPENTPHLLAIWQACYMFSRGSIR